MEIWKKCDFNESLLVSNLGNLKLERRSYTSIKNVTFNLKPKTLKQSLTGKGYKKGKGYLASRISGKLLKVHRLVAICFIENPNEYPQVNHIDGDTTNNKADNLEWCSNIHNSHHSKRNRDNFTCKYIGVSFRKDRGNYVGEIRYNGVRYRKSGFKNEHEANEYLTEIKKQLCL